MKDVDEGARGGEIGTQEPKATSTGALKRPLLRIGLSVTIILIWALSIHIARASSDTPAHSASMADR